MDVSHLSSAPDVITLAPVVEFDWAQAISKLATMSSSIPDSIKPRTIIGLSDFETNKKITENKVVLDMNEESDAENVDEPDL